MRDDFAVFPLDELRVADDAGVVDQHVDAAVLRDDLGGRGVHDVRLGDVDWSRHVPDHDFRAFALEGLGGGAADSGRAAGDDDDFVLEIEIHEGSSTRFASLRAARANGMMARAVTPRLMRRP